MSEHFDIAVVGGGAAGIAAAVMAARSGCRTLIMDARSAAGGTGGFSGLTTLCGLHDDNGQFLNDGFSREFAEALLREDRVDGPLRMGRVFVQLYRPESFQNIASRFLADEPLVTPHWNSRLSDVLLEEHRITGLNGMQVNAVIDCTGNAEVGRAVGEHLLATDDTTQAPSVVFQLENVECDLSTPVAVAKVLVAIERAGLAPVSFMPCAEAGAIAVKFAGQPSEVVQLIDFLQNNIPGFERCRTSQTEFTLSLRAGSMIVGQHVLTGEDILGARKFPDAVVRSSWPIEQWSTDSRPRFRYLSPGEHYEIPARCLHAKQTPNLFMAGKSLSADVNAVASARVMGCCLATGAAAGQLAAEYVKSACIQ